MGTEMTSESSLVVCSSPNGRGIFGYASYLSKLKAGRLITCRDKRGGYVLWEVLGILKYAHDIRFANEVIFANTRVSPLLWHVINWRRVTVVVHDLMDTSADGERHKGIESVKKKITVCANSWILSNSVKRARKVVFNSNYTRSEVERWLNIKLMRTVVIFPPPSFNEVIKEYRVDSQELRRVASLPKVLAVTGMTRNKMYGDYRPFHDGLQKEVGGKVKLVLYGISLDKAEAEFRQWVDESEDLVEVRYRRKASELVDEYLDCSLVCSLSIEEGYGMPVADALGFGIPVVARSIDAYKELKREVDAMGLLELGRDVDECVRLAARLIGQSAEGGDKRNRVERYKSFCTRSEETARHLLKELARKSQ